MKTAAGNASAASSAPVRPWGRWGLRSTAITYLVLAVALPLAAVVERGFGAGLGEFWKQVTAPMALDALRLTLFMAAVMTAVSTSSVRAPPRGFHCMHHAAGVRISDAPL